MSYNLSTSSFQAQINHLFPLLPPTETLVEEQRLKELEKAKVGLEQELANRTKELEEAEGKYSKAFVEYQAKMAKFEEEKKAIMAEVK